MTNHHDSVLKSVLALMLSILLFNLPAQQAAAQEKSKSKRIDISMIDQIIGITGTQKGEEYKITVPQNDLNVQVDGFQIIPPMGMGTWAAFSPIKGGVMVMGDIVVQENEIAPVQQVLIRHGLTVTALHNHFVREKPSIMYMHIGGMGTEEELARAVRAVFDKIAELRGGDPSNAPAKDVKNTVNMARIAKILGHSGQIGRGVYKVTIGRPDVTLTSHDAQVSTFMGFNTWAAWQGSPEHAAVAGDFAMLEKEVAPVIEALVKHGIEVVAVHNHMVHEQPRIFFLHYWGVGPAEKLAHGLRAALNRTGTEDNR